MTLPLLGSALLAVAVLRRAKTGLNQPEVQKCPYCGTTFTPNSHNQKFCSYQCRWDNRAKLKEPKRKSASEAGWVVGYEEKTANGKIQKEQEQTEAQPDGA